MEKEIHGDMIIKINQFLTEDIFMESLLNYKYADVNTKMLDLFLVFYALGKRWDSDRLIYYSNLIKNEN